MMITGKQYTTKAILSVLMSVFLFSVMYALWYSIGRDAQTMIVSGISMSPALNPGDEVRVQKNIELGGLKAGDLVAVAFKTRERKMLKRVIAVAGDEVIFTEGRLKINGQWLNTVWWQGDKRIEQRHYKLLALQLSHYDNKVPEDNLIVMGDNTERSFDSGDYGMISVAQIAGKVRR